MDASPRIMAALYLMQAGLSDLPRVARAVGLTVAEVRRIDSAKDPFIRRAAVKGLSGCEPIRLRQPIRCPGCGRKIFLVPCVACFSHAKPPAPRGRPEPTKPPK
jgi:hypothetical protein